MVLPVRFQARLGLPPGLTGTFLGGGLCTSDC